MAAKPKGSKLSIKVAEQPTNTLPSAALITSNALGVNSFCDWLRGVKHYSPLTIKAYKSDLVELEKYLTNTYEVREWTEVALKMLKSWIYELTEGGISPRSINRKKASANTFFNYLLSYDAVVSNPAKSLRALATKSPRASWVPEAQMLEALELALVEAKKDTSALRDFLIISLLYGCGLRSSELINLKELDVDIASKTIRVLGKRNKMRQVPLLPRVAEVIQLYIASKSESGLGQTHCLLVTDTGAGLYPMFVYRCVKNALSGIPGLSKRSPHVLRHTFATHLLKHGAGLESIKEMLGHANLGATQVYTHNTVGRLAQVMSQAHPRG